VFVKNVASRPINVVFYRLVSFTYDVTIQVIQQIECGQTLGRPANCPEAVYRLMLGSWCHTPTDRLSMTNLRTCLDALYREELEHCVTTLAPTPVDYVQPEKPVYCNQVIVSTSCDPVSASFSSPGAQYLQLVSDPSGVE